MALDPPPPKGNNGLSFSHQPREYRTDSLPLSNDSADILRLDALGTKSNILVPKKRPQNNIFHPRVEERRPHQESESPTLALTPLFRSNADGRRTAIAFYPAVVNSSVRCLGRRLIRAQLPTPNSTGSSPVKIRHNSDKVKPEEEEVR